MYSTTTDPVIVAAAERQVAAIAEARGLAPDNRHLIEDRWVAGCLEMRQGNRAETGALARHQARWPSEPMAPIVQVQTHDWSEVASVENRMDLHPVPADRGPVRRTAGWCQRCRDGMERAQYQQLWVLWLFKGTTIAEFAFCRSCADWYEDRFAPVVWKGVTDEPM